jgi:hypothetical protein
MFISMIIIIGVLAWILGEPARQEMRERELENKRIAYGDDE